MEKTKVSINNYKIVITNSRCGETTEYLFTGTDFQVKSIVKGLMMKDAKLDNSYTGFIISGADAKLNYGSFCIEYSASLIPALPTDLIPPAYQNYAVFIPDNTFGGEEDLYEILKTAELMAENE